MLYRFRPPGRSVCTEPRRGSRASELPPSRETEIDRNERQTLPAVSIRTSADGRAVDLAAKLASGAAEALGLESEPTRRLATVVVEGTRNAVEHAYSGLPAGDVEIELAIRGAEADPGGGELFVTIRDFGAGCPFGPTTSEPPGLGLSIISELSEEFRLSSRRDAGTRIDATIRIADGAAARERSTASRGSRLALANPAFLAPVIPRAIAVHAAAAGGSVDAVRAAIEVGRGIAAAVAGRATTLTIDRREDPAALEVAIGPIAAATVDRLRERLRSSLGPVPAISVNRRREERSVQVSFPLL